MEQKIITVFGKDYKVVNNLDGSCKGCAANVEEDICSYFCAKNEDNCRYATFQEVQKQSGQACSQPPPIGILPLVNHNAIRLNSLMDTLQRYAETGSPAKPQWVLEVKSLIEYERGLAREALEEVPFKL